MKQKTHAKDRREAVKPDWAKKKPQTPSVQSASAVISKPKPKLSKEQQAALEAAEAREFLDYLETAHVTDKDFGEKQTDRKTGIPVINLHDEMPTVEEAIADLRIELQAMKRNQVKAVKLIHGYGSTGKGGKIRIGIRKELAAMKGSRLIRDFITGEDFGPFNESSRRMADRDKTITQDIDYGRCNQGITVVII